MGQKGLAGERKGRDYKVEGPIDNNISAPRALREKRDSLAESPWCAAYAKLGLIVKFWVVLEKSLSNQTKIWSAGAPFFLSHCGPPRPPERRSEKGRRARSFFSASKKAKNETKKPPGGSTMSNFTMFALKLGMYKYLHLINQAKTYFFHFLQQCSLENVIVEKQQSLKRFFVSSRVSRKTSVLN